MVYQIEISARHKMFGGGGGQKMRLARRRAAFCSAAAARVGFGWRRRRNSAAEGSNYVTDLIIYLAAHWLELVHDSFVASETLSHRRRD